jgi:hypothetical protein
MDNKDPHEMYRAMNIDPTGINQSLIEVSEFAFCYGIRAERSRIMKILKREADKAEAKNDTIATDTILNLLTDIV